MDLQSQLDAANIKNIELASSVNESVCAYLNSQPVNHSTIISFQNASEIDQLSDRLMEVQTQLDNVTKENVTLTQSWRAMESEVR